MCTQLERLERFLVDRVSDAQTVDAMFQGWLSACKGPCKTMDTDGLDTVYNIENL